MKTVKMMQRSISDKVQLTLPRTWEDLSQKQLKYVCFLRSMEFSESEFLTYCFIRFTRIRVLQQTEAGWLCSIRKGLFRKRFFIRAWEVQYFWQMLDYLTDPARGVVRIEKIGRYQAVDPYFHGVPFEAYLIVENLYQGYLQTKDSRLLVEMAKILYQDKKGGSPRRIKLIPTQEYSIIQWYYGIKTHFSHRFPYFFTKVDQSEDPGENLSPDMESIMNSQIRALTGGDITKEKEILNMDTWRALTELNEKAREIKELEEKK